MRGRPNARRAPAPPRFPPPDDGGCSLVPPAPHNSTAAKRYRRSACWSHPIRRNLSHAYRATACPAQRWPHQVPWLYDAIPRVSRCSFDPVDRWKAPPTRHRKPRHEAIPDTVGDQSPCRSHGRQKHSPAPRHRRSAHPTGDSNFDHACSPAHTHIPLPQHPRFLVNPPKRDRFVLVGPISQKHMKKRPSSWQGNQETRKEGGPERPPPLLCRYSLRAG